MGPLFAPFWTSCGAKWGSFWRHFSKYFLSIFKYFFGVRFCKHFISFGGRFWLIFGYLFPTFWSTARKCAFFEKRHPSRRFARFLKFERHSGGSFFITFPDFFSDSCGRRFQTSFFSILSSILGPFWEPKSIQKAIKKSHKKRAKNNEKVTCLSK